MYVIQFAKKLFMKRSLFILWLYSLIPFAKDSFWDSIQMRLSGPNEWNSRNRQNFRWIIIPIVCVRSTRSCLLFSWSFSKSSPHSRDAQQLRLWVTLQRNSENLWYERPIYFQFEDSDAPFYSINMSQGYFFSYKVSLKMSQTDTLLIKTSFLQW